MDCTSQKALIVGLGNPGREYDLTRHNLGQIVLFAFAKKCSLFFKKKRELKGDIAKGIWNDKRIVLLFPTTYINLSGQSIRKVINFYKIPIDKVLILSDDAALSFGKIRFRKKGTSGGHNGLKNIEESLGTNDYQRLKLGIGMPSMGCLEDYVLKSFTDKEQEKIPEITAQAIDMIEEWLFQKNVRNMHE